MKALVYFGVKMSIKIANSRIKMLKPYSNYFFNILLYVYDRKLNHHEKEEYWIRGTKSLKLNQNIDVKVGKRFKCSNWIDKW